MATVRERGQVHHLRRVTVRQEGPNRHELHSTVWGGGWQPAVLAVYDLLLGRRHHGWHTWPTNVKVCQTNLAK